jgi:hypothetical protein
VGDLWDDILEETLADICRAPSPVPPKPLTELVPNTYFPDYKVHHARVYQQRTGNLCGYHAAFNTLCFLSLLQGNTAYDMLSGASFWRFKRSI